MSNTDKEYYSSIEKKIKWSLRGGGLLILLVFGIYFTNFNGDLNTDPDKWGPFGDFVGGILNPILAALAFYWLTASIRLQIQELRETKIELRKAAEAQEKSERHQEALAKLEDENVQTQKQILNLQHSILGSQQETAYAQQQQIAKQNFENLFFELIKTKNEALKGITTAILTHDGEAIICGTRVLQNILYEFRQSSIHLTLYYSQKMAYKLSSYNRVCENILELILSNKEVISSHLKYENIFTSTLTQLELIFLFYSGLFNKRLKFLLENLCALEALDFEYDCKISDLTKYAFLYNSEAFGNSKQWREYFKDFQYCDFINIDIEENKSYKKYILDNFNFLFFNTERELEFRDYGCFIKEINNRINELSGELANKKIGNENLTFEEEFDINNNKLKNELDRLEKIKLTPELYLTIKYKLDLEKTLKLKKNFQ